MEHSLFKCPCCDRTFKSEKAIRAHKARVAKPQARFSCIKCHKNFTVNNQKSHEASCFDLETGAIWNKGLTADANPKIADKIKAGGRAAGKAMLESGNFRLVAYWQQPENRKKKSEWRKKLHQENPETHPNRRVAGNRSKMTYPEKLVFDLLTEHKIDFLHNKKVDRYFPDFTIGKQIIEIDGETWHDAEADAIRDARLIELGYKVERFVVGKNKDLVERVKTFLALN